MPFYLKRGDLVSAQVDAIVNASNVNLKMVEGVGRAIFHKAGDEELAFACKQIGHCDVGDAVLTPSFNLTNCKAIIHAVGPIWINGKHGEEKNLKSAYTKSLKICLDNGFKSVAFPLLSGEFNYPADLAYETAESVFKKFLKQNPDFTIHMILFKHFPEFADEDARTKLTNYVISRYNKEKRNLDDVKSSNKEFVKLVKKYQQEKNISDEQLLINSNVSKEVLDEVLSNPEKVPSKHWVLAICVGLKLTEPEIAKLLASLGYNSVDDYVVTLIVIYFASKNIFDIYKINTHLFLYEAKPLGLE
ncbi:MAG: macro domain-containing protein [Bacilli bacterium]|nr:macro domain-containing protein [Bacilli bacterium]